MSAELDAMRDERNHWIGEAHRYKSLYRSADESSTRWFRRMRAAEAKVARVEALAAEFAHEYAATIDGEWGCCHDEDALRAGGRVPEFDGDEFDPLPADCPGKRHLDRSLSRLRAALAPAPTEAANVAQIGSDERVGTKEDA